MDNTIYFAAGLPRAGSTVITKILTQNPSIYAERASPLSSLVGGINNSWNDPTIDVDIKRDILRSVFETYYKNVNNPFIIDNNIRWAKHISLLEDVLQRPVKMFVFVRNPADILASLERSKRQFPLHTSIADQELGDLTSVSSRSLFYAKDNSALGFAYSTLLDLSYNENRLKQLLFIDYSKFCASPKSQLERIYKFMEIEEYNHDLNNITQWQDQPLLDPITKLPFSPHRDTLKKITVNSANVIGIQTYSQFSKQSFWDAWV